MVEQGEARSGPVAGSPTRPDKPGRLGGLTEPLRVADHGGGRVGLRVAGELDLNSHKKWEQALRRLLERPGDVHLDLVALRFIDARSTAALVRTADMFTEGRRLVLHHPPASLLRVLESLWPNGTPAIAIEGEAS